MKGGLNKFMSTFLKLNLKDISGAIISAVIVAVVGYLSTVASVTDIDFKQVLNIAFLAGIASLLKAMGTTANGDFLGAIKVK